MNRVGCEDKDVKEQDAASFPVPQSNNGLHPTPDTNLLMFRHRLGRGGDAGR